MMCYKGKGKVVPVLFFNWASPWRCIGECRCSSTHSWPQCWMDVWSASHPGHSNLRERATVTHLCKYV